MTEIEQLQAENATLRKRLDEYQQAYDGLKHQLQTLLRHRFGKKSERFVEGDSGQLCLFDEQSPADTAPLDKEEGVVVITQHKRRPKNARDLSQLPREVQVIPVPEEDMLCTCGCQKQQLCWKSSFKCKFFINFFSVVFF